MFQPELSHVRASSGKYLYGEEPKQQTSERPHMLSSRGSNLDSIIKTTDLM